MLPSHGGKYQHIDKDNFHSARDYVHTVYKDVLDDCLYHKLMGATKQLLVGLLTEYILSVVCVNNIRYSAHQPLSVEFGEALPWRFICCSLEISERYNKRERFENADYKAAL